MGMVSTNFKVMKQSILIFLLSIHTIGLSFGAVQTTNNDETVVGLSGKAPFLTSFIEGDQLYLNVPDQVLDKPMLFVRYDHSVKRKYIQVVWSRYGDKILLKVPNIRSTAGIILPLKPKLALSENILAVFPLEKKYNKEGSQCINITDLVLKQDIEWSSGFSESLVPQISLLLGAKNMDNETIVKIRRGIIMDGSKIAVPMYYAFCALRKPMRARRYDYRMGFYNERIRDIPYGIDNRIANISRWRLEKRDKTQKISVPKKPITFIMSPEIPKKWRPYVKAGIEEWLPAFESAGFKDALVVKEVDSLSDWQTYSIHTSIVHWGKAQTLRGSENEGFGGTVANIIDERTGEILKGDIYMGSSRQNYSERYFIRAAPLDKRAQRFPFPDELVGELYQCMVAHEVGHAFGIMDANYGEYSYPLDKVNDIDWLSAMGHTPSVMNYTRSNTIVQPGDSISPSLLNQKVGPADRYNIRWAYTEFPPGTSDKEEDAALEHIIREQDSVPWYRYNYAQSEVIGPANTDEVVETRDPVRGTEMALKNIRRVIELLPKACQDQKDNARLERLYDNTLELWFNQMQYVVSLIGGYDIQYKSINQQGIKYTPIALETQKEALDFLIQNAFNPPDWLVRPEFGSKIHYSSHPDPILAYQQRLLFELLRTQRFKRFEYMETLRGFEGALQQYLTNLQKGLFRELKIPSSAVKLRNQELQLTYIDKLIWILQQERINFFPEKRAYDYTDYSKGLILEQLINLEKDIEKALKRKNNMSSPGHWKLCLLKLNEVL